jgi:putative ABC transport system permease protein
VIREALRLALGRLRANAVRTMLTVIGIVVGIASVVTLVAVGSGSAANINDLFSRLGANSIVIIGGRGFAWGLTGAVGSGTPIKLSDATALERQTLIASAVPLIQGEHTVTAGLHNVSTTVVATTPSAKVVNDYELIAGSFFSDFADASKLRVAVLGAALARDLGLSHRQAVGTRVKVDGDPYVIVGVLAPQGSTGLVSTDDQLLVPIHAVIGRLVGIDPDVNQIKVTAAPGAQDALEGVVERTLRATHGLSSNQANDFTIINPTNLVRAQRAAAANFTRLIAAIAAISLVVGGIGIANIMLVAVRERTREIGIRRAIGARRSDIVLQFLTEATVLSLLGGLLGVALGLGLVQLLPHLTAQRTIVSYPAAVLALLTSGMVGILAGLGPANQAAALDPATALRYE